MRRSRTALARHLSRCPPHRSLGPISCCLVVACFVSFFVPSARAQSADLDECRQLLIAGAYTQCIEEAGRAVSERRYGETWPVLKAQAELAVGQYAAAHATVEAGLKRYPWSIRLRWVGHRACQHTGKAEEAQTLLQEINRLASQASWRYGDVDDLITLGRAALLTGADAREVLDGFYEQARRLDPNHREPYLAVGELALNKHDAELAADNYRDALKHFPDDPDVHFGLARALADAHPEQSAQALAKALDANPRHVGSLLFKVDGLIDSERFAEAADWIERVLAVNPRQPQAWAYRAVLAHLANDPKGEAAFRADALSSWSENPAVDHLIGTKLSQKYRFAEGAAYQRQALAFDNSYSPARVQLSQDLLRLGREAEGWTLADAAHQDDGYDVVTFNLLELRDQLAQFRTLSNDDFIVRMDAQEADVYGDRVLELLSRAKRSLSQKYGVDLRHPVTIEIFPDENDFAVRTFGMPAVSGYLGVCFGRVITANSPASQADHPSNWEAVLWHEFCHVVTLELTRNKMPRWLSEGISVYEERQENPAWGQRMTPQYREFVLKGGLTPIGDLSGAFLSPESPLHLQFAYYESALVVEFLVDRYGLTALQGILRDLGDGLPINEALVRHTDPLPKLEHDFETFARHRAEQLGPNVDWTKTEVVALLDDDGEALAEWLDEHPTNVAALTAYAKRLLKNERWEQVKTPLQKLVELVPDLTGADNPYDMLARVHRELHETEQEQDVLEAWASRDADAVPAYLRLIELATAAEDWPAAQRNAERLLAVNPLIPQPWRALAQAGEQLGKPAQAVAAYQNLLRMEPDDPAEIHYRLARLLSGDDIPSAKRHVLAALEEAPRFRAALQLLLDINRRNE